MRTWYGRRVAPVVAAPVVAAAQIVAPVDHAGTADYVYGKPLNRYERWQVEVSDLAEFSPEISFISTWLGSAMSQCMLTVVDVDARGDFVGETENPVARQLLAEFMGSAGGRAEMLQVAGWQMTVPGEFFVLADLVGPAGSQVWTNWRTASVEEVSGEANGDIFIDTGAGYNSRVKYAAGTLLIVRIWRPSPRRCALATSPCKALLPTLREGRALDLRSLASLSSRLRGAGVWAIPSEISFPENEDDPDSDPMMSDLQEVATAAIKDPNSAAASVPIIVRWPGDEIGKAKLFTFHDELDATITTLRERNVIRTSIGLDAPPEVLTGVASNGSHWSAGVIETAAVRNHVEPTLTLICSGLTKGYLGPLLEANGLDPAAFAISFDSSVLTAKIDQFAEALQLFDRGQITGEALRRYASVPESDKPTNAPETGPVAAAPAAAPVTEPTANHIA